MIAGKSQNGWRVFIGDNAPCHTPAVAHAGDEQGIDASWVHWGSDGVADRLRGGRAPVCIIQEAGNDAGRSGVLAGGGALQPQ